METGTITISRLKSLATRLTIAISLILLFPFRSEAFDPRLDGTMMPYDFSISDTVRPWGDDLKPVFINYIARHGARFLSSEKKVESIRKYLLDADREGRLTAKGRGFLRLTDTVIAKTAGRWGALNATGIYEENRLGDEMATLCPELLGKGNVKAISSYVPRVVMTMYEVCHALARHSSYLDIEASEGRKFSPLLRYFTTDSAYVAYLDHGDWVKVYDAFVAENVPTAPAALMITGETDTSRLRKLTMDAYGILQSLRASEIAGNPEEWFTEKEYAACWKADNLKHYLQRSANRFTDTGMEAAKPLLENIVATADSAFAGEETDVAMLRFGHAETVIPLFALMRLEGCYSPHASADGLAQRWKDWEVSPLGANLLMVCLKDDTGHDFVALRLNGVWQTFGGKKIVAWKDLRHKWSSIIGRK